MKNFPTTTQRPREITNKISISFIQRELEDLFDNKPHTLDLSSKQIVY